MWLSDLSIRQPHFITMLMVGVIVVGALVYSRMGLDLFPDVSLPVAAVRTVYPGASPSEVERSVSKVIEDAVVSINGVDSVRSTSTDGVSIVVVEFKLDRDAKVAADDVRTRVAAIRNTLPADIQEPVIDRFDPSAQPIMSVALSSKGGTRSPEQMRTLVDDTLKPRLERIPGVASVDVTGGAEREVHVDLNRERLEALGVAPQQVLQAIRGENLNVPGGRVVDSTSERNIKTSAEFRSLQEICEVPVASSRGVSVRVNDVASVSDGLAEIRAYRRLNGADAVVATVQKQSGTNTVAVDEAVKQELQRIQLDYPDVGVGIASDQAEFTKESVSDVQVAMVLGALLAALVVFAFFRDWRNTLVTVAGLPVIVLGTFAVMNLLGMSLNMLTLMALSLSIGMLIDDAIVVRENIFRHMEAGEEPKVAAQLGTAEIALAVLAVSSTIIAVFLPIAFTGGIVGKFLRDFGLTVVIAVFLSLVEAFTLAPMLSAYFFKRTERHAAGDRKAGLVERAFNRLDAGYRRALEWALAHRLAVLAIGSAAFFASLGVVPFMAKAFVPETDQGAYTVTLELPPGARLADTDRLVRRAEEVLLRQPEVANVFTTVGSDDGAVEKAVLSVKLTHKGGGATQQAMQAVRPELEAVTHGARLSTEASSTTSLIGGGTVMGALRGRPVQFSVQGNDQHDLDAASAQVVEALQAVPGAADVDRSIKQGKPSVEIQVDRARAADLGVSAAQVGTTVRSLVNGERAGEYRAGDKSVDLVVRLRPEDRDAADDLFGLPVVTARGAQIPLSAIARSAPTTEPALIERQDRQRQVIVGASVLGRDEASVITDARAAVERLELPPGVTLKVSGQAKYTDDSFAQLGLALGLSVLFVYMILASQFGSFIHPLTIMLALPFSIVGALLALFGTGRALDMMAMIGIILLMGLVTKNSILLVEFTNQLKRRGRTTREALLEAGPVRLRPILMTTLAMIFGMLPVALGLGAGAELRQPMGIGVIGGLLTSTILTLVAVPVAYSLIDDLRVRFACQQDALGPAIPPHSRAPTTATPLHVRV
jgi:HAE1 family hydrophobic/amphiphilic exporter-1